MFTGQEEQELQDTESQLANMKWGVANKVVNTVASTIESTANDFANLVTDWADIEPTLTWDTPTITGDVCGWSLKAGVKVKGACLCVLGRVQHLQAL